MIIYWIDTLADLNQREVTDLSQFVQLLTVMPVYTS